MIVARCGATLFARSTFLLKFQTHDLLSIGGIYANFGILQTRQDVQAADHLGDNLLHDRVSRRRGGSAVRIHLESLPSRRTAVVGCGEPRHRDGIPSACSPIVDTRLANGWNMSWRCAVRSPWRADRYSGLQPIASITRTPTKRATRILPMTVAFGPTWAGFSPVRPCKKIQPSFCPTYPSFAKTDSKAGSVVGTGYRSPLWPCLLFAIGGWRYVLWGIFLRTVVGLHSTWLVNSATHMWGRRRFRTR